MQQIATLPRSVQIGANDLMAILNKDIAHLLIHGGSIEDYVSTYYRIPAFMKSMRRYFLKKIDIQLKNVDIGKLIDIRAAIS